MLLAAYRDTGYNIVLLLHIITVIVSLAGAVAHPLLIQMEERRDDGDIVALAGRLVAPSRIYGIAFAVAGLIGFGLISMSDEVIQWGDTWVWLSIILWVAATGILHGALVPAVQTLSGGDTAALDRVKMFGAIATALILVTLYLMVLKPGV